MNKDEKGTGTIIKCVKRCAGLVLSFVYFGFHLIRPKPIFVHATVFHTRCFEVANRGITFPADKIPYLVFPYFTFGGSREI